MKKKLAIILSVITSLLMFVSCSGIEPDSSTNSSNSDSIRGCSHTYDNACDSGCNVCGEVRTPADHVYTADCDESCNVCGNVRMAEEHTYDNACDADCNVCGNERTPAEHVYDNEYDGKCNVCGNEREVPEDPVNGGNWTGEVPLK